VDAALLDPDPLVRVSALGALRSQGRLSATHLIAALGDPSPAVRVRAAQLAPLATGRGAKKDLALTLIAALDDDPICAVAALVALGDRADRLAVDAVCAVASRTGDPLVHEEAVATLGALGDERGLPIVLQATTGKPALRRRAVAALGAFDGDEVEATLDRLAEDRDWQVRQAVAMLRRGG
jgi:HEAT repeat protein